MKNKSPKNSIPLPKAQNPQKSHILVRIGKQFVVALVGLILIVQIKESSDGYKWVYEGLLKGNLELIKKYPNLSVDERYQMKMGFPLVYLNYIKQNTSDSAVILFPEVRFFSDTKDPKQDLSGIGDWGFTKYAYYRFLYPRKVVLEPEIEKSPFFEKVTHVAIINGWGYDYLKYSVPEEHRVYNTILSIHSNQ